MGCVLRGEFVAFRDECRETSVEGRALCGKVVALAREDRDLTLSGLLLLPQDLEVACQLLLGAFQGGHPLGQLSALAHMGCVLRGEFVAFRDERREASVEGRAMCGKGVALGGEDRDLSLGGLLLLPQGFELARLLLLGAFQGGHPLSQLSALAHMGCVLRGEFVAFRDECRETSVEGRALCGKVVALAREDRDLTLSGLLLLPQDLEVACQLLLGAFQGGHPLGQLSAPQGLFFQEKSRLGRGTLQRFELSVELSRMALEVGAFLSFASELAKIAIIIGKNRFDF